jgi:hypothetical protein
MAKKVEVEIDVKGNVDGSIAQLKELKKQLKQTAAGSEEFKKLYNQIDDLEDKIKGAKKGSSDWIDTLESAGGPVGMLGSALNKAKVATTSFGAALKATGIGLIVSLIGGLVGAFSQTEGAMKKLEPLMIAMEQIFGGIMEALQPLIDGFIELAVQVMPYVTKAFKVVYSAVTAVFQSLGKLGSAVVKLFKGDFAGAWEDAKSSVTSFSDNYEAATERFDKGAKKMTKTQKKNAADAKDIADKALQERLKRMEAEDKLDEAQLAKMKEQELALATTEQQKLDIEKAFAKKAYDMKIKDFNDKMALYKKDSVDYKNLLADRTKLEADYIKETTGYADKQKDLDKKKKEEDKVDELNKLKEALGEKKLTQEEYEDAVYELEKKYAEDKKALADIEGKRIDDLIARKKKKAEDERAILFQSLQNEIDTIDKKNAKYDNDFALDQERLAAKKLALEEQRALELQAAEADKVKQLEITKKYADAIYNVENELTNNQKAQIQARIDLQNMYGDAVQQFGALLQQVAGKNKGLAKAGLIVEQAAGVAKVIINTQAAAAKIAATSILGFADPRAILTYVMGGISVATAVAATVKGIRQIDAADASGGGNNGGTQEAAPPIANYGKNYGDGGMIDGPRHAAGGVMINAEGGEAVMTRGAVTQFAPLLSALNVAGGGKSFAGPNQGAAYDNPKVQKPTAEPIIVKTYVVSNELTTEQEKQAKLKSLSTL